MGNAKDGVPWDPVSGSSSREYKINWNTLTRTFAQYDIDYEQAVIFTQRYTRLQLTGRMYWEQTVD
jgi:hypothetical protein